MKLFNIKVIIAFFLASSISAFAVVDVIHLGSFGKSGAWQAKEFKMVILKFAILYPLLLLQSLMDLIVENTP